MGVTNTIAKLKEYFDVWHTDGKHADILKNIQQNTNDIAAIKNKWTDSLLSKVNVFFNTEQNNSLFDIDKRITANTTNISKKANTSDVCLKAWTREIIAQWNVGGADYDSKIYYNDTLRLGYLYFNIDAAAGKKKYSTNKYGYTDWIDVKAILNGVSDSRLDKVKPPASTFSCFCIDGKTKVRFMPASDVQYGYKLLISYRGAIDKNDVVNVRGSILYFY